MTTRASSWLESSENKLLSAEILTARLDVLVLLEDTTGKDRAWLLSHPEYELTDKQIIILNKQLERRAKHEPLAYIRGKSEFYGRDFIVNEHTLEPRPETETMLELLDKLDMSNMKCMIDVGTGSGAVAITAKCLFPNLQVYGTDIDTKCIQTAQTNATTHKVSIDFRQGNLLGPCLDKINTSWVILANLPYVPDDHTINKSAMFEPKHAIFGGSDGLDYYREMFQQVNTIKNKPAYIFTESLPFQHQELNTIVQDSGYKQTIEEDFIQIFRRR